MVDRTYRNQRLGIFIGRVVDDLVRGAVFDHEATAQHHDVIGHLGHHGQIMRDVERGHTGIDDRLFDRSQHFDLRRHVQRGRGFVKDHEVGFRAQCHRCHHALQLAARNLVRIAVADGVGVRQAQTVKQADRARLGLGPAHDAVVQGGFDHLLHQLFGRVEGGGGGLRNVGHFAPAQGPQARGSFFQDVTAIDQQLASGQAYATATVGHGGQADGGFAGAAFADQPEYAALFKAEGHAFDNGDVTRRLTRRVGRRLDFQVCHFQKHIAHPRPPFRLVVRFSTQSATRLTEIASVAMAKAGIKAAEMP